MRADIVDLIKEFHLFLLPMFILLMIYRSNMQAFREFVDALHSPGATVLVGYALIITGVVMMKIALMDDGKYIVGTGAGILAHALAGSAGKTANGDHLDVTAPENSAGLNGGNGK